MFRIPYIYQQNPISTPQVQKGHIQLQGTQSRQVFWLITQLQSNVMQVELLVS